MALMFSDRTTNGSSSLVPWHGGEGTFFASGDFSGGTCALQASFDSGVTWIDVGSDVALTSPGAGKFSLGVCLLRVTLASAASPNVTAGI